MDTRRKPKGQAGGPVKMRSFCRGDARLLISPYSSMDRAQVCGT